LISTLSDFVIPFPFLTSDASWFEECVYSYCRYYYYYYYYHYYCHSSFPNLMFWSLLCLEFMNYIQG
jgi:hypothetical protein